MYDAFISYNHAADGRLATALRDGLQRFAKPWNRRRAMRVFLDRSSLELTPDLGDTLQQRLRDTRFLVLLASARSAASRWCDEEAAFWLREQGAETLLIVVTDGTIVWDDDAGRIDAARTTALPPSLVDGLRHEPLWLDLRWVDDEHSTTPLDLRSGPFRDAVATLAASITGVSKDDLDGEDVRQHERFKLVRRIAVTALAVLTVGAVVASVFAVRNAAEARANAAEARSRELAARALAAIDTDPEAAVVLATEAMRPDGDSTEHTTVDAERALGQALRAFVGGAGSLVSTIETPATAIAVSPDGRTLATGSPDSPVRFWDVTTGAPVTDLAPNPSDAPDPVGLRFNFDGSWVTSIGDDGSGDLAFVAWSLNRDGLQTGNGVSDAAVGSVAYSVDGEFAYGAIDETLFGSPSRCEPDPLFGACLAIEVAATLDSGFVREALALADGSLLVVDDQDVGRVFVGGNEVPSPLAKAPIATAVASVDGAAVALELARPDGTDVEVWVRDGDTWNLLASVPVARVADIPAPGALALRGSSTLALLGAAPVDVGRASADELVVVDLATGGILTRQRVPEATVVDWLPARGAVVVGTPTRAEVIRVTGISGIDPIVSTGAIAPPSARTPDGSYLAETVAQVADDVSLFVALSGPDGDTVTFPGAAPFAFDRGGRLAYVEPDGALAVRSIDGTPVRVDRADAAWDCGDVVSFSWSADDELLVAAFHEEYGASCAVVFDVDGCLTGGGCVVAQTPSRPGAAATSAAVAPDGRIVVGYDTGGVAVYRDGRRTELRSPHRGEVSSIAFDDRGALMATSDGRFALWDAATGTVLQTGDQIITTSTRTYEHVDIDEQRRRIVTWGTSGVADWPDADLALACTIVSDEALDEFAAAEIRRDRAPDIEPACRRLDLR